MNFGDQIREQMEVVGSDGEHVGIVDTVEGDRIKLTRSDPAAGGQHRYVMFDQVEMVDGDKVYLMTSSAEVVDAGI